MSRIAFEVTDRCPVTRARRGVLRTAHGEVETPCFMPVGTQGTVKTLGSEDLEALGYGLVLANTYHLALRPGAELIERHGGLHRFMSWKGAILTDSGGYQVMSLSHRRHIDDNGVRFQSHIDGSLFELTPERAVGIQGQFGVDVSMMLDECPPYPCTRDEAAEAMRRTHLWAPRNLAARREGQSVFGIVQGGVHEDLRRESAEFISALDFDGVAIGGVSVGEPTEMQRPAVEFTAPLLPESKPRYLMGVGHPQDILHAVACGVDMFDCVLPTRMARHHTLYTLGGRVNAQAAQWAGHDGPYDPDSVFPCNERYSAAYVRHLFKAGEFLALRLATLHNLAFYSRLMAEIREAVRQGTWGSLLDRYREA
ncbi:MAG: tRNA guanosine(34) transglycosylase Tgt [Fimbriimonadaceae bacterium]|nr:tRNA guanosine(34) transglycosylase Tgt [Fimbriimonadaceae bacterium]QYK58866.1 MAG: tRNA guanosine(34) transglycosylase Tgt [Fimbriimonadaceae bacterium]